MAPMKIRRL